MNDSLWVGVFERFVYQYKEVKNSSRLSDEVTGIFNLISDQTLPHLPVASSRTPLLIGQERKKEFIFPQLAIARIFTVP